jgi:hypothetical protein
LSAFSQTVVSGKAVVNGRKRQRGWCCIVG